MKGLTGSFDVASVETAKPFFNLSSDSIYDGVETAVPISNIESIENGLKRVVPDSRDLFIAPDKDLVSFSKDIFYIGQDFTIRSRQQFFTFILYFGYFVTLLPPGFRSSKFNRRILLNFNINDV